MVDQTTIEVATIEDEVEEIMVTKNNVSCYNCQNFERFASECISNKKKP